MTQTVHATSINDRYTSNEYTSYNALHTPTSLLCSSQMTLVYYCLTEKLSTMLTVQTLDYLQKIQLLIRVRPMPCRHPIPDTIGRCYTDTDTWLNKFFCTENAILCGYRCVHVIYVCGIYVRKYGIGLKL